MAWDESLPVAFSVSAAQGLLALLDRLGGGPDPAPTPPSLGARTGRESRQFVRVTSATITSGTQPAKLQTRNAGVLSDGADVLAKSANGDTLATGTYEGLLTHLDGSGKAVFQVGKVGGGGSALTLQESDGTPTVSNATKLTFASADFAGTDAGGGEFQVKTVGVTGTDRVVCDWTCVGGVVTVKYRTNTLQDGLTQAQGACG